MHQKNRFIFLFSTLILVLSMMLAACQPAATPEPTVAPTLPPTLGTAENPIKVLFVPSVDANVIVTGGEIMADALKEATGYEFEVSVPTSYAATVEEMCASPEDTMGFLPPQPYVFANELCGVDVSSKAVRRGYSTYWTQFLVKRDSDIKTMEDLAGKSWGFPDPGSTSGYLFPAAMFKDMGIEVGEKVETGGQPQSVKAVYDGSVDFATSYFSPYGKPEDEPKWVEGDAPDIPDELVPECKIVDDALMCGDYLVLDARQTVRVEAPDVVQEVRILGLTPAIPNDTLSFGPDFPADVRAKVEEALLAFSKTPAWADSLGNEDFYGWTGLDPATDADYDFVRLMIESAGIKVEDLDK